MLREAGLGPLGLLYFSFPSFAASLAPSWLTVINCKWMPPPPLSSVTLLPDESSSGNYCMHMQTVTALANMREIIHGQLNSHTLQETWERALMPTVWYFYFGCQRFGQRLNKNSPWFNKMEQFLKRPFPASGGWLWMHIVCVHLFAWRKMLRVLKQSRLLQLLHRECAAVTVNVFNSLLDSALNA